MTVLTLILTWWALGCLPMLVMMFTLGLCGMLPGYFSQYHGKHGSNEAKQELRQILRVATVSHWTLKASAEFTCLCLLLGPIYPVMWAIMYPGRLKASRAKAGRAQQDR